MDTDLSEEVNGSVDCNFSASDCYEIKPMCAAIVSLQHYDLKGCFKDFFFCETLPHIRSFCLLKMTERKRVLVHRFHPLMKR